MSACEFYHLSVYSWEENDQSELKGEPRQRTESPSLAAALLAASWRGQLYRKTKKSISPEWWLTLLFLFLLPRAMYGAAAAAAAAAWRRAITVRPQGTGQDGQIGTVSAASESMTPLCKHSARAGTAFVPPPKDAMRSQSGVQASTRRGWRASGGY